MTPEEEVLELRQEKSLLQEQFAQRDELIAQLQHEIARLREQVDALQEQLNKDSHTSHLPPSSDRFHRQPKSLRTMDRRNLGAVEVRAEIQEAFATEMQKRMQGTVWTSGCKSWYLDANGHNTTLWPGFTFEYRHRTRHFDPQHYTLLPQHVSTQDKQAGVVQSKTR